MNGPEAAGLFGAIFCIIAVLIGSVILQAAISFYNSLAGGAESRSRVPELNFFRAMRIVFAMSLVSFMVNCGISILTAAGTAALGAGPAGILAGAIIGALIVLLVEAAMLSMLLPTTFGRALLVCLCHIVASLLFIAVFVAAFLAFGFTLKDFQR